MHKHIESTLRTFYTSKEPQAVLKMYERGMEKSLLELFAKFDITASVKSDPKSLPFQDEVIVKLPYESYVQGMFEYRRCYKAIFKKLLNENVGKIRFYIHIETDNTPLLNFGCIVYYFRYFVH
jgi:hypothetical protein